MQSGDKGLCNQCRARVPAEFFVRDGQEWIRKHCPLCGPTESLVSADAGAWQAKRDAWGFPLPERTACTLKCDRCRIDHKPNMVFVDVTNRCNMNCPICIATIRGMGFDFNPPLEYFDKVFAHIGRYEPKPMVELFGGEPTVRDDLLDIIALGRKHGLRPRIITNGVRLADEEYCRRLCESGTRMRFAFDGRNADIYEKLRHNRAAYDKKLRGLENLAQFSRRRQAIIACAAWGINDGYLGDLIQYCHDHRDLIAELGIIPLTENWEEGEFDAAKTTTMEDVEKMVQQAVVGGHVQFAPAGLSYVLRKPRSFFRRSSRSEILLFGGVHPNCESMTLLVSDGKCFRSIDYLLKKPFAEVARQVISTIRKIEPKLDRLDPERFWPRLRGRWLLARTLGPLVLRTVRLGRLLRHALGDWLRPRGALTPAARKRRPRRMLRVAVLPFEELHSVDSGRMEHCKAVFAYEDMDDGEIKTIPACMWYPYRNDLLKKISAKYGRAGGGDGSDAPQTPTQERSVGESSEMQGEDQADLIAR